MNEVSSVLMTEEEARECVHKIHTYLDRARQLLLRLYNQEGWRALGYDSFSDCIESEFKKWSRSYLYRQLAAARLEDGLGWKVGELPESHARAVLEVMGDDEEGAMEATATLGGRSGFTASDYRKAAWETWVERNVGYFHVYENMREGKVSPKSAYEIGKILVEADDEAKMLIERVGDPQLAQDLLVVQSECPSIWRELLETGAIPYDGESIALEEATYTMLRAWVTLDNAEARAQYVEHNRAFYDSRDELVKAIISIAKELGRLVIEDDRDQMGQDERARRAESLLSLIEELEEIDGLS